MRILYVVHQFYPKYVSGTEQYVLTLARAARRRGDDVRVFAVDPDFRERNPPEDLKTFDYEGVPVTLYRFDKAAIKNHVLTEYRNPPVGAPFRALLDQLRPELIHFFHLLWVGVDRMEDARARRIPYVVHLMDFWYLCANFLLLRPDGRLCDGPYDQGLSCFDCVHQGIAQWAREPWARDAHARMLGSGEAPVHETSGQAAGYAMVRRQDILRDALKSADCVIAPSRTVAEVLARAGTESPRTVHRPYSIDWDALKDLKSPPASPITMGFMGTFAPHKGVDVLLRAFRQVRGDVRLNLHGRFGDYPEFDDLLKQIAADDRRIEFKGAFPRSALSRVLSDLHVLVVPSLWRENTPFVCLEARAAGLLLIVSDLDGMKEAVPTGRGRSFRAGDPDDLAKVMGEVIADLRARGGARLPADTTIPTTEQQYEDFRLLYASLIRSDLTSP